LHHGARRPVSHSLGESCHVLRVLRSTDVGGHANRHDTSRHATVKFPASRGRHHPQGTHPPRERAIPAPKIRRLNPRDRGSTVHNVLNTPLCPWRCLSSEHMSQVIGPPGESRHTSQSHACRSIGLSSSRSSPINSPSPKQQPNMESPGVTCIGSWPGIGKKELMLSNHNPDGHDQTRQPHRKRSGHG